MRQPFNSVREQLLSAGIAPRHANRYITELREHLADLAARERASGLDAREADERALALLGDDQQLAQAMIDKGATRSLAARAPWCVFAVLPVVMFLAVMFVTGFSMLRLLWPVHGLAPADIPDGYASLIATVSFFTSYLLGPLIAAACIAVALRQRMTSSWIWAGLGLVALVSGPFGFHMHSIPTASGGSQAIFSGTGIVYLNGHVNAAATLSVAALRTAVLFTMAAITYRVLQSRFMPLSA